MQISTTGPACASPAQVRGAALAQARAARAHPRNGRSCSVQTQPPRQADAATVPAYNPSPRVPSV